MSRPVRYPELDLLRSLAIVLMIAYHTAYDLWSFHGWDINLFSGGWLAIQRGTAVLFLLLVGVGFAISFGRTKDEGASRRKIAAKYARRGAIVIGCGLGVSLATWLADPETFVRFGILHLIGVSALILPFFAPLREWNVLTGLLALVLGPVIGNVTASSSLLLPLGAMPADFSSVDYYPLLPWFGWILLGVALGNAIYVRGLRPAPASSAASPLLQWLTWPGRYALWIYLAHQPILLVILRLIAG